MSSDRFTDERLKEAFGQMDGIAERGAGCPSVERLVLSTRGELPASENKEVYLHITRCPACAAAWRAVRELSADAGIVTAPIAKRPILRHGWARLAAAAVFLIAVIGGAYIILYPDRETAPVYRTQRDSWLQSALEKEQALPRESFMLRWTPGPEGTYYDLVVLNERLEPLTERNGLAGPEYRVPSDVLAEIPSGSRILWQVFARVPDGQRIESETFITEIE